MDIVAKRASPLREAVKTRFYPFAASQGFVKAPSTHPHFAVFRRLTKTEVQVFELQWDKYHRQCFVVNFGDAPITGTTIHGTHVPAASIETYQCTSYGQLTPRNCPYVRCWFRQKKPLLQVLKTGTRLYQPDEVVDQLVALFPELDAWWTQRHPGTHLRFLRTAPSVTEAR